MLNGDFLIMVPLNSELVEKCLQNDRKAQYELYEKYSKAMYNLAVRMVNDLDEAEDVLQESFIKAFRNLKSFKGDSTFGAWLKRIVINQSLNHLRKRRQLQAVADDFSEDIESETQQEDEQLSISEELLEVEKIRKAIHQLPDGFRVVFTLYLLEGYDHQEIADILEISVSTSKSQYNRAKKKLRQLLQIA